MFCHVCRWLLPDYAPTSMPCATLRMPRSSTLFTTMMMLYAAMRSAMLLWRHMRESAPCRTPRYLCLRDMRRAMLMRQRLLLRAARATLDGGMPR